MRLTFIIVIYKFIKLQYRKINKDITDSAII